ncbi:hypothetical protein FDECE_4309 [Fusarium decemcellulare]|nr:hypothetical protein FDECE_4309 [Fusarium decemcellulare]
MDCSDTQTQHGLLGMATSAFLFVACCSWAEKDASQYSRQAWRTFCLWQHVQDIIISIMTIAYIWLLAQTSAACSREACTHGFNFALGLAVLWCGYSAMFLLHTLMCPRPRRIRQRDPPPPPYEPWV